MTFEPEWVVHPGRIVKEELEANNALVYGAVILGIGYQEYDDLIGCKPKGRITEGLAIKLATFGGSPQLWMNLQKHYDEGIAKGYKEIGSDQDDES